MENEVSPDTQVVTPGSSDHDALMVAKFQEQSNTETTTTATDDRPSWLPEKFQSPEDMAASYAELEKKLSQGGQQQTQQAPAGDNDTNLEQARQAVQGAGLDFDALGQEFLSNGSLSDDSYKALADKGFDRDLVDDYIDGQQAKAQLFRAEALLSAGGEDTYEQMATWAASNLSKAELIAYNSQVDSGNLAAVKMAIQGLRARFEQANGEEPSLLNGSTGGNSGEVFRSTSELTAAMRDPRYKKDPAYRADVERKLSRSNTLF